MHERNERQPAHPWLLARQRSQQLDLPPGAEAPPSSARMALEAVFVEARTPPSDPRAHDEARTGAAMPAVVVKRKRAFAAPEAPGAGVTEPSPAHQGAEDDRAPRVFRVDSAPVPISPPTPEPPVSASAAAAEVNGVDVEIPPIPVTAARRPRRRAAPVTVTTIAAPQPEPPPEQATFPGEQDPAGPLLERLAALDATFSLIQAACDFRVLKQPEPSKRRRELRSYFALIAEIERLQGLAEAKREAEAAKAISWIRQAIEAYGLTRRDLGI